MQDATELELIQLLLRVLCDKKPQKVDALFIHCGLNDSAIEQSLIEEAVGVWSVGGCDFIVLNGLVCDANYQGYTSYLSKLLAAGVPKENILALSSAQHTGTESEYLIALAKEKKWQSLIIESMPYHQMRCFLQIVAEMKRSDTKFRVYNLTFHDVDWNMHATKNILGGKNVLGQEYESGRLVDFMKSELERIQRYAVPSDRYIPHATVREALEYLSLRENLSVHD